jgi:hypothetical protein
MPLTLPGVRGSTRQNWPSPQSSSESQANSARRSPASTPESQKSAEVSTRRVSPGSLLMHVPPNQPGCSHTNWPCTLVVPGISPSHCSVHSTSLHAA